MTVVMEKSDEGFNMSEYVGRKRKIHRYHMIDYVVTAIVVLLTTVVVWK